MGELWYSNLAGICHHRQYSELTPIICLRLLALVQPHTVDPFMIDISKRHLLSLTISHGRNKHSARSPRVDIATISLASPHATPGMAPVTGLLGRNSQPSCVRSTIDIITNALRSLFAISSISQVIDLALSSITILGRNGTIRQLIYSTYKRAVERFRFCNDEPAFERHDQGPERNCEREVLAMLHILIIQKVDRVLGILMPRRSNTSSSTFILTSPATTST